MNKEITPVQEVLAYLREAGLFHLATCEGDQPRVRPFGAEAEFEGRLYIETSNRKKCFDQMMKNHKVEISAMGKDGSWLRVAATVVEDDRREARQRMMDEVPSLSRLYSVDDGKMEVLYLKDATATFYSFTGEPRVVKF